MTRRRRITLLAAAAVLLVLVVAVLLWWSRRPAPTSGTDAAGGPRTDGEELRLAVDLYYPGEGTLLRRERRELAVTDDPEAQLLTLARAVVAGPATPSLLAPLPGGVSVRAVQLTADGVVFVDLVTEDGSAPPPSGSTEELLRVYSLVNTLLLNVAEARSAVLLWNGAQPETLSGHLDLTRPLVPDTSLVADGPPIEADGAGGGGSSER